MSNVLTIFSYDSVIKGMITQHVNKEFEILKKNTKKRNSFSVTIDIVERMGVVKLYKSEVEEVKKVIYKELSIDNNMAGIAFYRNSSLMLDFLRKYGLLRNDSSAEILKQSMTKNLESGSSFTTMTFEHLVAISTNADFGNCSIINPKQMIKSMIMNERGNDMLNDSYFLSTASSCMGMRSAAELWKYIDQTMNDLRGAIKLNRYNL